jgi:hypothetical protein
MLKSMHHRSGRWNSEFDSIRPYRSAGRLAQSTDPAIGPADGFFKKQAVELPA